MNKSKKICAVCAAAAMTLSLTGCTDTSYVLQSGDVKVNAGIYIYNMYSEMSYQISMLYYTQGVTENYFDQEIEGKKFEDYLSEQALKATKEYVAVVNKFEELGLELTEEETKEISDSVRSTWESYGDFYESEGISKDSVKLVQKASKMRTKIFDYYYGEGGEEAVSDSDIESYLNENYLRYKTITIAKSTNEDETAAASENEEKKALRDEYLEKANGVSFADFDTVINEYNDYVAAQSAQSQDDSAADDSSSVDSSAADSSAADSDSSTADDTSSELQADSERQVMAPEKEDSSTADNSSAAESKSSSDSSKSDDSITADESSASDDSSTSDESTADSESGNETTDEDSDTAEDPYAKETLYNYGAMDDEAKESNTGKLAAAVNGLEVGVATAYEDDNNYYIIIKGDIKERSAEYASENHDNMVQIMKYDEFQAKVDSWVEATDYKENKDAIKRYTPKAVYDKQVEYQKNNK